MRSKNLLAIGYRGNRRPHCYTATVLYPVITYLPNMKFSVLKAVFIILAASNASAAAFVPAKNALHVPTCAGQRQEQVLSRKSVTKLYMGGKMSKFGVFSPAVYIAKFALGTERLNKIRGKAISLHSQYIGDFCEWVGAYHLRTQLIKKAKTNGDILGFLV
jgi:hypothetical protein